MKKYKKLTEEQLRVTYASWYSANSGKEELAGLAKEDEENSVRLAVALQKKPQLFRYPPAQILAGMLNYCGFGDEPEKWLQTPDPQQAGLDFLESDAFNNYFDGLSEAEQGTVFSMIFAVAANLEAVQIFSRSMHELIQDFAEGDEDALFKAVVVDRTVVSEPLAQLRIQVAEIMGDEEFFDKLAKAIKRSRPGRPDQRMDDVRAMLYVLDDVGALAEMSNAEVTKCLVDDLQVYDEDTRSDPSASLAKFVQRFKKARTRKP